MLRRRATQPVDRAPVAYIGTPARQVAGQILSGDKPLWEIAVELIDVLGPHTALMLAQAITVRAGRTIEEDTL